nr:hypothetical protein [Gemmatimonadaceae bacterium]
DVDAAALYVVSLLGLNQGDREPVAYARAADLAESLFVKFPNHPGAAHYLIHAVDDPDHARRGLAAARAYSAIAPSAGHALHMTSHIFLAMGMWDDVARANDEAMATIKRAVGHSVQFSVYGLLQAGRRRDARRWLDSLATQRSSSLEAVREDSKVHLGLTIPAYLAETKEWKSGYVSMLGDTTSSISGGVGEALFGDALAAVSRGKRDRADSLLARLIALRSLASTRKLASASDIGNHEVREKTLRAMMLRADRKPEEAVRLLRFAAEQEAALPMDFGPPVSIEPPREAAGEILLALGRAAEARAEFLLALARAPGRSAVLLGLARAEKALGNRAEAARRYGEVAANWHAADGDWPALAEVRAGAAAH